MLITISLTAGVFLGLAFLFGLGLLFLGLAQEVMNGSNGDGDGMIRLGVTIVSTSVAVALFGLAVVGFLAAIALVLP